MRRFILSSTRLSARGLCLAAALALPLPPAALAQDTDTQALLDTKLRDSGSLTVEQRLTLLNIVTPDDPLTCRSVESENCARRVTIKTEEVVAGDSEALPEGDARRAHRLLSAWAERSEEDIRAAQALTEKVVGQRKERRAAAAAADQAQATDVSRETVTDQTSRSSDEDRAESGDDTRKLLAALGIIGVAAVAGKLLDNGDEVVEQQGDRLVVRRDGELVVRKDETELLRRPGSDVETGRFADGSTRTVVTRPNGTRIVTIRDADGEAIRRTRILADGREVLLFDDTATAEVPVDNARLANRRAETVDYTGADVASLRAALRRDQAGIDRSYSLRQIRNNVRVRNLVPQIDLDGITFATGSAAIHPREAEGLARLGTTIRTLIDENPSEVFLIEGHTDAIGGETYNLALSDRRAESVALALAEYFDVPPENLVVQGYGERYLKIETQAAERANRRAVVRRITPLLAARR